MGKVVSDGFIDGGLVAVSGSNKLTVCAGQPTSYADIAVRELASTAMTGGDFTIANGDTSGRKVSVAQKSSISITSTGTGDHIAVEDASGNYLVTTCPAQGLSSGGTVTTSSFDLEISDPT